MGEDDPLGLSNGPFLFCGSLPYTGDDRYSTEDIYNAVSLSLRQGIRHVDTAELYTEALPFVARAISDNTARLPRSKLFISSKIRGLPSGEYYKIKQRVEKHLSDLNTPYLDLLLIHWPGSASYLTVTKAPNVNKNESNNNNPNPETLPSPATADSQMQLQIQPDDHSGSGLSSNGIKSDLSSSKELALVPKKNRNKKIREIKDINLTEPPEKLAKACTWVDFDGKIDKAWENMLRLREEGLVKRIGVSNFYAHHLTRLLESKHVKRNPSQNIPYANQIYLDATAHQYKFVHDMERIGIHVMGYRPLEYLPNLKTAGEMGDTVYAALEELKKKATSDAKIQFKSLEQFILSWLLARNINVVVKSSNGNHIKDNYEAIGKAKLLKDKMNEAFIESFPEATEMSIMMMAFDAYAEVFEGT